jgi:hypothetical protein
MKLQFRVLIMFAVIFVASYIPDAYPSYFGDWLCNGSGERITHGTGWDATYHYSKCNYSSYHNPRWHWGFRHWAWLCLGITMLIINIVQFIQKEVEHQN